METEKQVKDRFLEDCFEYVTNLKPKQIEILKGIAPAAQRVILALDFAGKEMGYNNERIKQQIEKSLAAWF